MFIIFPQTNIPYNISCYFILPEGERSTSNIAVISEYESSDIF